MNSKELRIGNYILCFDIESGSWCVDTVARLDAEIYTKDEIEAGCQCNDNVSPIPLTEEWLLNFGFAYNYFDGWYEKGYGRKIVAISFDKEQDVVFVFCKFNIGMDWEEISPNAEYEYVHQLQNLYFALTNEELKLI